MKKRNAFAEKKPLHMKNPNSPRLEISLRVAKEIFNRRKTYPIYKIIITLKENSGNAKIPGDPGRTSLKLLPSFFKTLRYFAEGFSFEMRLCLSCGEITGASNRKNFIAPIDMK